MEGCVLELDEREVLVLAQGLQILWDERFQSELLTFEERVETTRLISSLHRRLVDKAQLFEEGEEA